MPVSTAAPPTLWQRAKDRVKRRHGWVLAAKHTLLRQPEHPLDGITRCLNAMDPPRIVLIDVGCFIGKFLRRFSQRVYPPVWSIGIDPVRHPHVQPYSVFVEAAVARGPEQERTLYEYTDPSCNSLLRMDAANITHDPSQRATRWFVDRSIEGLVRTRTVPVWPLSRLIEVHGLQEEVIHFLKIDAQGTDLDVFLSLGRYLPHCLFVQLETVYSGDRRIRLYEGQTIFEDERPVIEREGFRLIQVYDHGRVGASPEADVIFVNTRLYRELQATHRRLFRIPVGY